MKITPSTTHAWKIYFNGDHYWLVNMDEFNCDGRGSVTSGPLWWLKILRCWYRYLDAREERRRARVKAKTFYPPKEIP